jgi:cytochrome c556
MHAKRLLTAVVATATLGLTVAVADQPFKSEIEARQGQFKLLAFNLGPLVGMAQGNAEYDAEVAQIAADNIAALASLHQARLWPAGSGNDALEGTRALPAIWEDTDDFLAKASDLREAALGMQQAAGTDLNALRGALRGLGAACSACHEGYRQPQ